MTSRRRLFAGGALLGLVFLLRIQLAPALVVVALWTNWRGIRQRVPLMLAGAAVVLSLAGVLDCMTLGSPLVSVWRYIVYNVYYGASSTFGVEAWNFYLLGELGVWGGAAATLLPLAALGARRMPLLLAVALVILATHSLFAHKEYRFIYPAILLVMTSAGIGLAQMAIWGETRLRDRGNRGRAATLVGTAVALGWWCVVSLAVWTSPTLADYRYRGHDQLAAISFVAHGPALCGLGLYGHDGKDWVDYGGYSYLHRSVPEYWPKNEAELARFAAGFDTLLYTKTPPEDLGFTLQRCFGKVCVARRSTGCASLPMMPMPFPDPVARPPESTPPSSNARVGRMMR
jgi:GPI mannosyltransferase 3